jgi:hypothetical protein
MADVTRHREAVVKRILDGKGKASQPQRRAAFDNAGVAEPARALIDKVVNHASKITDEDVAAVKQTLSEDEIFELVVCAAIGQATRQLDAALAVLDQATEELA